MEVDPELLRNVFRIAPVEKVNGRKYYATDKAVYEHLAELAKQRPALQPAVDESIRRESFPSTWYLIPADRLWSLKE